MSRKEKNYVGMRFGRLVVVEQERVDGHPWCLCRCECGNEPLILANKLITGARTHCGCSPKIRTSKVDRVGERWGSLEIIGASPERSPRGYFSWLCRCDCGKEWLVSGNALREGGTTSCGCRRQPRPDVTHDHTGKTFHDLVVMERFGSNSSGAATWRCRCICGQETIVAGSALVTGNTKSCGCRLGRVARSTNMTHGRTGSYLLRLHDNIKQRCYNSGNKSYPNYGGRGIGLAPEWMSASTFMADVVAQIGERPSEAHSFDRINNDGNYEPGNVRWATRSEQALNRRQARDVTPLKATNAELQAEIVALRAELKQARGLTTTLSGSMLTTDE